MEFLTEESPKVKIKKEKVQIMHSCNNPVLEKIRNFQEHKLYCDVILQTGGRNKLVTSGKKRKRKEQVDRLNQLTAHSCILATGSAFFQRIFLKPSKCYHIQDVSVEYLQMCVDFIYRKPIEFLQKELEHVLKAAKSLEIIELEQLCIFAETSLSIETTNADIIDQSSGGNIEINNDAMLTDTTFNDEQGKRNGESNTSESYRKHVSGVAENPCRQGTVIIPSETENETIPLPEELEVDEDAFDSLSFEKDMKLEKTESEDDSPKTEEMRDSQAQSVIEKSFYCCHCKDVYSVAKHHCSIINKTVRLRLSYKCQVCKEIVSSAHLSRHRKKHPLENNQLPIFILNKNLSDRNYHCRFCDQDFSSPYHFCSSRNKKVRIRVRIVCHLCGKNISSDSFALHMKRSHSAIKHKCKTCDFEADFKKDLADHMIIHYQGKTYMCNICGKSYRGLHSLAEHKFKVHNILRKRKRYKTDAIYTCLETGCDFENYSSRMVTFHMLKEHKDSKNETLNKYIKLYQKKKNCIDISKSIPEYESLKDIMKKKETDDASTSAPLETGKVKTKKQKNTVGTVKKQETSDIDTSLTLKPEVAVEPVNIMSRTDGQIVEISESITVAFENEINEGSIPVDNAGNIFVISEPGSSVYRVVNFDEIKQSFPDNSDDRIMTFNYDNIQEVSGDQVIPLVDESNPGMSDDQQIQVNVPTNAFSMSQDENTSNLLQSSDIVNFTAVESHNMDESAPLDVITETIEIVSEIKEFNGIDNDECSSDMKFESIEHMQEIQQIHYD